MEPDKTYPARESMNNSRMFPIPKRSPVYIVDPNPVTREALAKLVSTQGWQPHAYGSAEPLLSAALPLREGCAVVDPWLLGIGLDLLDDLQRSGASIPVILVAGYADVALAVEAMRRGAANVIERPYQPMAMLSAIRNALHPDNGGDAAPVRYCGTEQHMPRLTPRETEVLQALVRGKPTKVIARELRISPRTVEVYRSNIMTKIGADNIVELVRLVISGSAAAMPPPR